MVTHLDLNQDSGFCRNSLRILDGRTQESPELGRYCDSQIPQTITTSGNAMTISFGGNHGMFTQPISFRAVYSLETTACGGTLTAESGRIANPGYPDNYPINAECIWTFGGSPGNRVQLTFIELEIEESQNCNRDYVEVHRDSAEGPLLLHTCGSDVPSEPLIADKLWLKFNSDNQNVRRGFLAEYSLLHGGQVTGSSGVITSPMYPHIYSVKSTITWNILAPTDTKIVLKFDEFFMFPLFYDGLYTNMKVSTT